MYRISLLIILHSFHYETNHFKLNVFLSNFKGKTPKSNTQGQCKGIEDEFIQNSMNSLNGGDSIHPLHRIIKEEGDKGKNIFIL